MNTAPSGSSTSRARGRLGEPPGRPVRPPAAFAGIFAGHRRGRRPRVCAIRPATGRLASAVKARALDHEPDPQGRAGSAARAVPRGSGGDGPDLADAGSPTAVVDGAMPAGRGRAERGLQRAQPRGPSARSSDRGEGAVFTAGATWVVDLAPEGRRGRVIGLYGLAVWGGLSLGPPIGDALLRASSFDAVWAFTAISPLIGALVALQLPDPFRPDSARARHPFHSARVDRARGGALPCHGGLRGDGRSWSGPRRPGRPSRGDRLHRLRRHGGLRRLVGGDSRTASDRCAAPPWRRRSRPPG